MKSLLPDSRIPLFIAVAALLMSLCCSDQAWATVVERLTFQEMAQGATRIVHVRCRNAESFLETSSGTIWTRHYFEVIETLKGEVIDQIVVTEPGGVVGAMGQWVAGASHFRPGDESVLFLSQTPSAKWRVHGWGQGNYRVERDPLGGEPTVRPDLGGIQLVTRIGNSTEWSPAPSEKPHRPESLPSLMDRIRKELAAAGLR